ncbi:MAG: acyltransferase family protein [Agriterribacter sp.]
MQFRSDIQGLRALAVILVFLFHINPRLMPGGFVGVDVFFVISGFLISSIILQKKEHHNFRFIDFYNSRIKRIIPAFTVMVLIVGIIGLFLFLGSDARNFRNALFWSWIFNSNNYFSSLDTYFGTANAENPFLHTWTLAVEMKFYLFLPFLLFFIPKKWLPYIVTLLIISLLFYAHYNIFFLNKRNEIYFSLLARMPEFLIGTLLAIFSTKKRINKKYSTLATITGFILILASAILLNEASPFPGFVSIIPCLGASLLIFSDSNFFKKILETRVMVYLGECSYSLYLWHWPIMALIRYYNNRYDFNFYEVLLICSVTMLISYLSYTFVENYFRKLKNIKFYVSLAIPTIVIGVVIVGFIKINRNVSNIPVQYAVPTFGRTSNGTYFEHVDILGDTSSKTDSIIFIGDSHTFAYLSFLDYIGKTNHFSFKTISNDTYPTIPGIDQKDFSELRYYNQYKKLIDITQAELNKSSTVIISSTWSNKVPSLPGAFDNFLKNIDGKKKVYVLTDYPILKRNPLRANRDFIKNTNRDNHYEVIFNPIPDPIKSICDKYPWVKVIYLNYKDLNIDYPFYKDTLMYFDAGHVNEYGSRKLGKLKEKEFMEQFELHPAHLPGL